MNKTIFLLSLMVSISSFADPSQDQAKIREERKALVQSCIEMGYKLNELNNKPLSDSYGFQATQECTVIVDKYLP